MSTKVTITNKGATSVSIDSQKRETIRSVGLDTAGAVSTARQALTIAVYAADTANSTLAVTNSIPAFIQANLALSTAQSAFQSANNVAPQVAPAFNQANTARDSANTKVSKAGDIMSGVLLFSTSNNLINTAVGNFLSPNSIDVFAPAGVGNWAELNYANQNFIWVDSVGAHLSTDNNTVDLYSSNGDIRFGLQIATANLRVNNLYIDYYGNIVTPGNTSAQYFYGNGAFLTGIVTDFSPAFNRANLALATAQSAFSQANAAPSIANSYATQVGTSGNAYALSISTSIGTSGNSYATSVGIAGNTFASSVGVGANTYALAAFNQANNANITAQSAFNKANDATTIAIAAYNNANSKFSSSGGTITGNVDIVGNLTLSGNTFIIDATRFQVDDPLIYLAANNYQSDIVDIGFIGNYVNATGANVHTGLYREHEDKMYYLFQGYDVEPINNHIGAFSNNMTLAVLNADIRTSNLLLFGANAQQFIISAFTQANAAPGIANSYATAVGAGGNAYATVVGASANARANVVGTSSNSYATSVGTAGNTYADTKLANTTGTFAGTLTIRDDLVVLGNATLGDANTDRITINGNSIALGNNQNIDSGTLFIDAVNNRVGIGTTNTVQTLSISGSIGFTDDSLTRTTGDSFNLVIGGRNVIVASGSGLSTIRTAVGAGLNFINTDTSATRMFISDNVGFGITSPTSRLHVVGTANITSNLIVQGIDTNQFIISAFNQANTGGGGATIYQDAVNSTRYITFVDATSGSMSRANVDAGLTFNPSSNTLTINGPLNALTKSFLITHPTKPNMKLRYGSLEGPENGVYVRGVTTSDVIELPNYWTALIDEASITVNLTGINSKAPSVKCVENNKVYLNKPLFGKINCYYTVFAERKDVDKLIVEF